MGSGSGKIGDGVLQHSRLVGNSTGQNRDVKATTAGCVQGVGCVLIVLRANLVLPSSPPREGGALSRPLVEEIGEAPSSDR